MAANLIHKYVWLVNTIHRARLISLEDINREWLESDIGDGKPLPRRTFHVWQAAILDIFGLIIENENKGQYRYYIANEEELRLGTMSNWLLDSLTVSGMLASSRHIRTASCWSRCLRRGTIWAWWWRPCVTTTRSC